MPMLVMKHCFRRLRSVARFPAGFALLASCGWHSTATPFPWVCSFDGNDSPDIFWHYKGNSVQAPINAIWLMDGINITSGVYTDTSGDPNWSAVAVGRFHQVSADCLQDPNRPDKNRDILWRHTSAALVAVWYMSGTTFQGAAILSQDPGASWRLGAAADFNEDGYSDIVWDDNATGAKVVWLMQGGNAQASPPQAPSLLQSLTLDDTGLTSWRVLQAADFGSPGNSMPDGHADLLLYNLSMLNGVGTMQIWYLQWNPASQTIDILNKATVVQTIEDGDWKPLQAGNLNPSTDGKTDIIFRHATFGQNAAWYMDGSSYVYAVAPCGADLFDTDWKMLSQGNEESTLRIDILEPSNPYQVRSHVAAAAGTGTITLNWTYFPTPDSQNGEKFRIWRKLTTATSWGDPIQDNLQVTSWQDATPQLGVRYDYKVALVRVTGEELATGAVSATVTNPSVPTPLFTRGRAIVIVDGTLAPALTPTLQQLKRDLVADGWDVPNLDFDAPTQFTVPRHVDYPDPPEVPGPYYYRDNNYGNVLFTKSKIRSWLQPGVPNVALLIGHVPVPYSGYGRTDGHNCCESPPDHGGAWACDLVYATPKTSWPDDGNGAQRQCLEPPQSDYTNCYWEENSNHGAGDGKFDLDFAPGSVGSPVVEVGVGRVDFARLTRFVELETTLITRYFDKIHRFRYNLAPYSSMPFQEKGVAMTFPSISMSWGVPWINSGIEKMVNLYGPNSLVVGDPFRQNQSKAFAWGFPGANGCVECIYSGTGTGVYTTAAVATTNPEARIGFFIMVGSYFIDFDKNQDFMRASIATPDYGFSAMGWSAHWNIDSMSVGEHLGASLARTVDTWVADPAIANLNRSRFLAIMGDPTLRLYRVPAPNVTFDNSQGYASMTWIADGISTYYVYGANSPYGPWTELTTTSGGSFIDSPQHYNYYMVRAAKLVTTASSGTYWETSQGIVKPE